MGILQELFADLPRQGPGAPRYTRQAVEATGLHEASSARILELGCGSGGATLVLAGAYPFAVLAIDRDAELLARLDSAAARTPLRGAVETRRGDMNALEVAEGGFDAVWSEGAAYIVGFAAAVGAWRRYLRPGGVLVLSELSWLTDAPPVEARAFWGDAYPAMATVPENVRILEAAGYRALEPFVVGPDGFWDLYYRPLEARIAALAGRYGADPAARALLDQTRAEIDLYRAHGEAYSYVFYMGEYPGAPPA